VREQGRAREGSRERERERDEESESEREHETEWERETERQKERNRETEAETNSEIHEIGERPTIQRETLTDGVPASLLDEYLYSIDHSSTHHTQPVCAPRAYEYVAIDEQRGE
jgi:hypothetical protein